MRPLYVYELCFVQIVQTIVLARFFKWLLIACQRELSLILLKAYHRMDRNYWIYFSSHYENKI